MKRIILLLSLGIVTLSNAQNGLLNGTGYAPDFTASDLNGTSHTIYDYLDSGYVMVLELMSVTCGHCQSHAAGTENAYLANGPSGTNSARFLGLEINATTDSSTVANFASNYGVTFPIANDISPGAINYQLSYTPTYYVIYPDYTYTTICAANCLAAQNYATIEGLLNTAIAAWTPPVYGCTDSTAANYDMTATVSNDSCDYTSYTITTVGMSFSPDTIVCDVGDTINFVLGAGHNAVEVSDSTWVSGGSTPIAGGFSFGYGATGMYVPDDCHTFYYVCQPHAGLGMKGIIIAHHPPVFGCTDSTASNYDSLATVDDGSCFIYGCTGPTYCNYNPLATMDDGSCWGMAGCMDPSYDEYNPIANCDDGSCSTYSGVCNAVIPTGLFVSDIVHTRATINWDNMNASSTPVSHVVNAGNFHYSPSVLNINIGDTVYWINDGGYHNVNFDVSSVTGQSYNNPVSFVTNPTTGVDLASYVFDIGGTYQYDCSVGAHAANGMVGTIQVNSPSTCVVDQYRIRYREVGTSSWSTKTMGAPIGSCFFGTQKTDKLLLNLTASTTYEYEMKAWYCGVGASAWTGLSTFTTNDNCPNVGNLAAVGATPTKATFTWDASNGVYAFVRLKARVDSISNPTGGDFFQIGGAGVSYGTNTKNKNNLVPGETYRGQARTYCDPNGGAWKSVSWSPLVYWTQPTSRVEGGESIANLDVYPNPSRDVFNVTFTSEDVQDLEVRVINLVGEVVYTENLQQFVGEYVKSVDLAAYTKGVYFLEITTDNGMVNKKLILQ